MDLNHFVDTKDGLVGLKTAIEIISLCTGIIIIVYKGYASNIFNMIFKSLAVIIPIRLSLYTVYLLNEDDFYNFTICLFKGSTNKDEKSIIARSIENYCMSKIHNFKSIFYSSILYFEDFVKLLPYFEYSDNTVLDFLNDILLVVLMNSPILNINRSTFKKYFSYMLVELVNKKFDLVSQEFVVRRNDLLFNRIPLNVAQAYSTKLWGKILQEWEPGRDTDIEQFLPLQYLNETDLSYLLCEVCEQIEQASNISFKQPLFAVVKEFYMGCKCFNRDIGEKVSKVSLRNITNKERVQNTLNILCRYIYQRNVQSRAILDIIICLLWSCGERKSTDNPCFILAFDYDYVWGQWFDLDMKRLKAFRQGGLISLRVRGVSYDVYKSNTVRKERASSI